MKWFVGWGFFCPSRSLVSDDAQATEQIKPNYLNGSAARKHSAVLKALLPAAPTAGHGVWGI